MPGQFVSGRVQYGDLEHQPLPAGTDAAGVPAGLAAGRPGAATGRDADGGNKPCCGSGEFRHPVDEHHDPDRAVEQGESAVGNIDCVGIPFGKLVDIFHIQYIEHVVLQLVHHVFADSEHKQ